MKSIIRQEEELREALVNLERAREQERKLRIEHQGLLECLRMLSGATNIEQMFSELLGVLRNVIGFEEAFVLAFPEGGHSDRGGDMLVPLVSTAPVFLKSVWRLEGVLARTIAGQPTVVFDAYQMPEWQAQTEKIRAKVRSALFVPLRRDESPLVLICTHSKRAFFRPAHSHFVQNLSPLVEQVLLRLETEELLRESEEKYRTTFESTGTATVIVEEDTTLSTVNSEFEKLCGYSKEEIEGKKNWTEFVLKDDLGRMKEYHRARRIDPSAAPKNYEFRFIDRQDNIKDIFLTIAMIPGTKRSVASLLDITERVRAQERLKRQLDELTVLHAAATASVEAASEDELIERVTQIIGETLYSDNIGVLLLDEPAGVLRVHPLYRGVDAETKELTIVVGQQGVTGQVAATGQPRRVPDVTQEPAYLNVNPDMRSELCVPLKVGERVIGVINAESSQPDAFSEADERLLVTLSGQLATAIERLRTEATEREQRVLVESLHDTAVVLNSTLDFDEVLDRILENVGRVVPFEAANIMLIEGDVVRVARQRGYAALGLDKWITDLQLRIGEIPNLWRILETQQPLVIADAHADPEWVTIPETGWIRSYAAAPIRKNGDVIGVLNLDHAAPGFFTPAHVERLQAFADQVAIALKNARLYQSALNAAERRAILHQASQQVIAASHDLELVYEAIHRAAEKLMPAEVFAITLADEAKEEIELVYAYDKGVHVPGQRIPAHTGLSGHVIDSGASLLIPDLETFDCDFNAVHIGGPQHVRSILAVPVVLSGQVSGILSAQSYEPHVYTIDDQHLLEMLAAHASAALENAQLFERAQQEITERKQAEEQIQRQLQRLAALHNIDMAITASVDLRVTLKVLLDQVTNQLYVDATAVLLLNPHTQNLEYAAGSGFRTTALQHTQLRLGRGHAGRAALERRILNIPDLAEEVGDFARNLLLAGEDFVAYYAVPLIAKGQVKGVLEIFHRAPLDPNPEWLEFLKTLAAQAAIAIDNATLFSNLQRSNLELALAYDATLEGWVRALDLRDKETEGHTQRVTELALRLARAMGIDEADLLHLRRGALLHDIGKMGISDNILRKAGPLSDEEWEVMRQHPVYAYQLLKDIPYLKSALEIPYCHHEKWDGSGYPRSLKGVQIPLVARIFAVVDVWDALCNDRPYRKAWTEAKALEYIREQAGKHFDPQVVEAFLKLVAHHSDEQ